MPLDNAGVRLEERLVKSAIKKHVKRRTELRNGAGDGRHFEINDAPPDFKPKLLLPSEYCLILESRHSDDVDVPVESVS